MDGIVASLPNAKRVPAAKTNTAPCLCDIIDFMLYTNLRFILKTGTGEPVLELGIAGTRNDDFFWRGYAEGNV